jgi:hypothetical protein
MNMPTGYTAAIKDGISFEKFVWTCARAFGALVTMRDDSMDTPIPQAFTPSPYYAEALAKARGELTRLKAMTTREVSAACAADFAQTVKRNGERIAEANELRDKYAAMLAKVQAWTPPTPEHEGMKTFMAEQITESIWFDCGTEYLTAPTQRDPQTWHAEQIAKAIRDVRYHEESNANENQRTAERNAWLAALRESVPPAP